MRNIRNTLFLLFLLLLTLSGCQSRGKTASKNSPGIGIDAEKAESVSIYYRPLCYSFFSEDKDVIAETAGLFQDFSLEEVSEGSLDQDTVYEIYFANAKEQVAAINVDGNSTFYLPETGTYYRVSKGTFHLETLEQLYKANLSAGQRETPLGCEDSIKADGYDNIPNLVP